VRYRKPSEGVADSVPYRAETDADYCPEKAAALKRTLEQGGWKCERLDGDVRATSVGVPDRVRAAIAGSETFEYWAAELGRAELMNALVVETVSDLNGDGSPEYLARVDHPKVREKPLWTGSELLAGEEEGFRHLFSGVLEIRVLASHTGGYRDIAVRALPADQLQPYWLAKYTGLGYRTVEIHQHKLGEHPKTHVERRWDEVAGGFTESETLEGASELVEQF
jgi:hypothetical protein